MKKQIFKQKEEWKHKIFKFFQNLNNSPRFFNCIEKVMFFFTQLFILLTYINDLNKMIYNKFTLTKVLKINLKSGVKHKHRISNWTNPEMQKIMESYFFNIVT